MTTTLLNRPQTARPAASPACGRGQGEGSNTYPSSKPQPPQRAGQAHHPNNNACAPPPSPAQAKPSGRGQGEGSTLLPSSPTLQYQQSQTTAPTSQTRALPLLSEPETDALIISFLTARDHTPDDSNSIEAEDSLLLIARRFNLSLDQLADWILLEETKRRLDRAELLLHLRQSYRDRLSEGAARSTLLRIAQNCDGPRTESARKAAQTLMGARNPAGIPADLPADLPAAQRSKQRKQTQAAPTQPRPPHAHEPKQRNHDPESRTHERPHQPPPAPSDSAPEVAPKPAPAPQRIPEPRNSEQTRPTTSPRTKKPRRTGAARSDHVKAAKAKRKRALRAKGKRSASDRRSNSRSRSPTPLATP